MENIKNKAEKKLAFDKIDSFETFKKFVLNDINEEQIKEKDQKKGIKLEMAVLGFDVFQYSQYPKGKAKFVPMVFDLLLDAALSLCLHLEKTFYYLPKTKYLESFQHTGDGGFLFFEKPIEAVIFNTYFYYCLRLFNSKLLFPAAYELITSNPDSNTGKTNDTDDNNSENEPVENKLTFRSAMTFGECNKYSNVKQSSLNSSSIGYIGPAVVTCARILARDRLDRLLIDSNTYNYFSTKFFGLENLPSFDTDSICYLLNQRKEKNNSENVSEQTKTSSSIISNVMQPIRSSNITRNNAFIECRTHKIGKINSKKDTVDIYNAEIKVLIGTAETLDVLRHVYNNSSSLLNNDKIYPEYIVTLIGNLNTLGLGETQLKIE